MINKLPWLSILIFVLFIIIAGLSFGIYQTSKNISQAPTPQTPSNSNTQQTDEIPQSVIKLYSESTNPKVNQEFNTFVLLETGDIAKNGGKIVIKYDPAILQVAKTSQAGDEDHILRFKDYDVVTTRSVSSSKGEIQIDLSTSNKSINVSSNGFAFIKFKALKKGVTKIEVDPSSKIYFIDPNAKTEVNYDRILLNVE